jgi:hypothetical protein
VIQVVYINTFYTEQVSWIPYYYNMLKLLAVTAMFYELFIATTTPTVPTTAADVHPGG